jgi:hypothetical protein
MGPILRRLAGEMPQLDGLYIFDERGNRVATSSQPRASNANNSDREYFIYHRDHDDPEPRIHPSLLSRSTDQWVIPMSRRLIIPMAALPGCCWRPCGWITSTPSTDRGDRPRQLHPAAAATWQGTDAATFRTGLHQS